MYCDGLDFPEFDPPWRGWYNGDHKQPEVEEPLTPDELLEHDEHDE